MHLYTRRCRHVGSDFLPIIVNNFVEQLKNKGVTFLCNTKIETIEADENTIQYLKNSTHKFYAQNYLIAPGRLGARWLQDQARIIGLNYTYQKVEIGVRTEFRAGIMEKHSKIMHENIYAVRTPTYDDIIRTFCPCPNGFVAIEKYDDYVCVNGHSRGKVKSPNSNFDLTTVVQLTEPVENTTDYAISIAKTATIIGGGKPLLQRLEDLRNGRRSTWNRINKSFVSPTI